MIYRIVLIILLLPVPFLAAAQLSDRVNNPTTLRAGTRPIQGNMGVYFGMSYNDIVDLLENQNNYEYSGIPLVSLKYYVTDRWAARLGFQTYKESAIITGEVDPALSPRYYTERNFTDIVGRYLFTPGVEYHFASTNLPQIFQLHRPIHLYL